jgi:hypothetical protein
MLIATQFDLLHEEFISIGAFSSSNDESDFPKYLNIKFDFCEDVVEIPESEGDGARVKLLSNCGPSASGFFLCLIRDVKIMRIMTARVAPVPMAMSNKSPCDCPSIETFGTVMESRKS